MTSDDEARQYDGPDAEARRDAVLAIENDRESIRPAERLIASLGDTDWRVRKEAVRVATDHALRLSLLPELVNAVCQGENVGLRNAALEVLIALGSDAAQVLLDTFPVAADNARRFILEALVCGGDRRVVPTLIEAVDGDDAIIAATAMDALATIGGERAEAAIRRGLRSSDPFHRLAAIDGLNKLRANVSWQELAPLLEDRLVRRVALVALGRCAQVEAVVPLIEALSEKSAHVVSAAAKALCKLYEGPPQLSYAVQKEVRSLGQAARASLRELLGDAATEMREAACIILCVARDVAALPGVVELVAYNILPSRAQDALREWGPPAVRALLDLFEGRGQRSDLPAPALELACLIADELTLREPTLGEEIRRVLRQACNSPDPEVVLSAARCMEKWAEPSDARALVELAQVAPEDIAQAAGHALLALAERDPESVKEEINQIPLEGPACPQLLAAIAAMGGENAFESLKEALSSQDPAIRQAAVTGLARLGGAKVAEVVAFALADESLEVQAAAALALGRLRDNEGRPVGVDALLAATESDSPDIQIAVARALGETGDRRAIGTLRQKARSTVPGVAVAAIEGLRRLRDPHLEELLIESLKHEDQEAVKQALIALSDKLGPKALDYLRIALEHPSWDVRQMAAETLEKLADPKATDALRVRLLVETDELVIRAIKHALSVLEGSA